MKTYLVTGVSRGLGNAVAKLLLEQGHRVHGTYLSGEKSAEELAHKYENLSISKVDLGRQADIEAYLQSLRDESFDGIVNAAGVFLDIDFNDFDKKAFEDTFRINTFAPLYLVQGLQEQIKDRGSIVNIASNDAFVGSIVGVAYSASKASLINITQSLANILAPRKIRANVVAPGWMGDGMQAPSELLELAKDYNPLKHIGSYEEIAHTVLFLLSDDASYVNGTTLTVDGGDMATNYILQKEAEL
jgi:NAD(P)-dependent dehydrogenase (short-subunit alcohol dehydrogenase family)